ncbi:MAG: hypothetical protein U0939_26985 [Pirellulales bacterium]
MRDRADLRRQFDGTISRLWELNQQCDEQLGERLLARTHDPAYPFESSDPMHWFIACVSYLCRLFFDAAKKTGLSVFLSFSVEGSGDSLIRLDDDAFQRVIRVLRTFFQHNLNPEDANDRKQIAEVKKWFVDTIGCEESLARQCARHCVASVLDSFSITIERLSLVIPAIQRADEVLRQQVREEIARNCRAVAEHEIARAIQEVVKSQGIDVDWKQVQAKYQERIIRETRESACSIGQFNAMLLSVCEKYCYEMMRQPPSVGAILKEAGFVDRQVGELIGELNRAWKENPRMTHEEYRIRAREMAGRSPKAFRKDVDG